ncbi:MAG: substrate-binding domain-containing protein [Stappiaceae bacterium]
MDKGSTEQSANPRRFVSASDVARHAGVSRSAVSRTFTEGASVSKETREKVLQSARALGYQVNHLARGLIQSRSNIVCLVTADAHGPFRSSLVHTISRRLQQNGKVPILIIAEEDEPNISTALDRIFQYRADVTIVLSGTPPREITMGCLSNGQQVIHINRDDPDTGPDRIVFDHEEAAHSAFDIFQKAGIKHPALITSTRGTPSLLARQSAFLEIAEKAGIEVAVFSDTDAPYDCGQAIGKRIFDPANRVSPRPDGAFCLSDLIALGFIDAARCYHNLSIPEDIAVIGFDDIPQAHWKGYDLTTFRQSPDDVADAIMYLIHTREEKPSRSPEKITIPAKLVARGSFPV